MSENYAEIEERVQSACKRYFENEEPNIALLARDYAVPQGRLRARIHGRPSKSARPACNQLLSEAEELAVCLYLKRLDTIGTSARILMLTGCANAILSRRDKSHFSYSNSESESNFTTLEESRKVGPNWTARFLERHPEFHIRKQKTLDIDRKKAHNPDDLLEWFRGYKSICDEHGVQTSDIYNFDETGFRIGIGKDRWIITLDPDRQCYLASSSNRELITSCEVISGDGYVLPPMLIISGAIHLEDWVTKTALDDDVLLGLSETGYSNDILALEWLSHFNQYSSKRQIGCYRLLLLDGYGSHCTKEFIDYCDSHKIIPFCLPPHTTHLLQPLDVVVFQPLKHYHSEAIEEATRTGCGDFNKIEFLSAIGSIRKLAFKPSTIISAFKKTGLIPYSPDIVLSKLRENTPEPLSYPPKILLDGPDTRPSTPQSHPSEPFLTTLRTVRSLKRHADYLWRTDSTSQPFRNSLYFFLKGSLAQANLAAQLQTDLEHTEAAQLARANRQKRTRRSIRKGGVLKVGEARSMVHKRDEDDMAKKIELAQLQVERLRKAQAAEKKRLWKPILKGLRDTAISRLQRLYPTIYPTTKPRRRRK